MKYISMTVGLISLVVLGMAAHGFTLFKLWGWYVVPYFNLPPISIPIAIGLSMMIALTTHQNNVAEKKTEGMSDKIASVIMSTVGQPLITLFIGWVVTFWL